MKEKSSRRAAQPAKKAAYNPADSSQKQGFSAPQSMIEWAKNRAKETHGGNLSLYIQSLIEADMKGRSATISESPLESLLREYAGDDAVPDKIERVKQRAALTELMEGYAGFLHHFDSAGNDLADVHSWTVGVVPVAIVDNALAAFEHNAPKKAENDVHLLAWFCGPAFEQRRNLKKFAEQLRAESTKPAKK